MFGYLRGIFVVQEPRFIEYDLSLETQLFVNYILKLTKADSCFAVWRLTAGFKSSAVDASELILVSKVKVVSFLALITTNNICLYILSFMMVKLQISLTYVILNVP